MSVAQVLTCRSHARLSHVAGITGLILALSGASASAFATDHIKKIGVQGGFAAVSSEGSFAGYGGALSGAYGITDAWYLVANVTASSNQVTGSGGRSMILSEAVGLEYALDVLQIVPYFGLYGATYYFRGGGLPQAEFKVGAQLALGVNYLVSRDISVGLELRAHALPSDFLRTPDNPVPFYGTTFVKCEYTWGWF